MAFQMASIKIKSGSSYVKQTIVFIKLLFHNVSNVREVDSPYWTHIIMLLAEKYREHAKDKTGAHNIDFTESAQSLS